jgi:glycerol-1-phosphate dehydrogenase [NAD(P)+]
MASDFKKLSSQFDREKYEADIRRIYGSVADEVIALQDKLGWYNDIEKRIKIYREKETEIKGLLFEAPSFSEMRLMLNEVGMSYDDFVNTYGEKKIRDAYLYAKDLKDRYTVLWMYYELINK